MYSPPQVSATLVLMPIYPKAYLHLLPTPDLSWIIMTNSVVNLWEMRSLHLGMRIFKTKIENINAGLAQ